MMVPVGRLTVMKIVPRDQYMAAMTFVTLPGESARCSARRWAGCWWSTPRHWIFLINIPVGIVGAIATLCLMPNYTMQTRRFDLWLSAAGRRNGDPDHGARRPERARHFPARLAGLVAVGLCALLLYLWHARGNAGRCLALTCFATALSLGLGGSFAGRIGSGMLPFMTPVFLQIGLGFSPFTPG